MSNVGPPPKTEIVKGYRHFTALEESVASTLKQRGFSTADASALVEALRSMQPSPRMVNAAARRLADRQGMSNWDGISGRDQHRFLNVAYDVLTFAFDAEPNDE